MPGVFDGQGNILVVGGQFVGSSKETTWPATIIVGTSKIYKAYLLATLLLHFQLHWFKKVCYKNKLWQNLPPIGNEKIM